MRRTTACLGIMLVGLLAARVHGATLIVLESDAGDYLGGGQTRRLTSAGGAFVVEPSPMHDINIQYHGRDGSFVSAGFFPPVGRTLLPGSYPYSDSAPTVTTAGFVVGVDGRSCPGSGHFVVHEARFAPEGTVIAFAADFEHRCGGVDPALRGAVRVGAVDGSCTTPLACSDGDPCTADRCDGGSCVADPIAGCWSITGRGVLTAWATGSGNGRTATCTLRCQTESSGEVLILDPDGTYRMPVAEPGVCPSGVPFDAPDEVGTVVRRRKRLILKPSNRPEIMSALRRCTGSRFALKRYRTTVALDADGTHLTGTSRIALVIPGRYPTHVGVVLQFNGALGGPALPLGPPARRLQVCAPGLSPVCVVR